MAIFDNSGSQASQHNSSVPPRKAPFKKGDFIGQNYEIFDVLGEGGFGIVYLVYSHETKSAYALKTFRDKYIADVKTKECFRKEAQIWIDLEKHPYLVRAYMIDEISGRLYIAMEHIASDEPGLNTIEGYLRRRSPDLAQSLKWAIQFCHGMEYAYSKGIKAHRDIKPANIMIDQNKTVKITDFGLAGVFEDSSISEKGSVAGTSGNAASMQTAIGESIGTPEYMSPEQFTDLSACDERSDIYSFGIVLYQMASGGRLPFNTDNPALRWPALKHFHQEMSVPKLNTPLFPVIQRCLEKEPRKRYQTFKELRADLEPLLKQQTGEIVKLPELKELEAWEWNDKGVSLKKLGKIQEAITCFETSIAINPKYSETWNNKGNSLSSIGKDEGAITCYIRALEINPKFAAAWYNEGSSLRKLGRTQEAISCYDKAIEIDPRFAMAWSNKGNALRDLDKYQEAIACYDKSLEINPGDDDTWNNKGNALGSLGREQEAIVCYDKAIEINPTDAVVWYNKGYALGSLAKTQDAIACLNKALAINPKFVAAWFGKALAEDELNEKEMAINSYKHFLQFAPAHDAGPVAHAHKRLDELSKMSQKQEELACYHRDPEVNTTDAIAWHTKGNELSSIGKHQEAIGCYDKALELNPRYADAWNYKGFSLLNLDKDQEAIACYDRALEINPGNANAWINKGAALARLDKLKEAIPCFEKALELNPQNALVWINKGIAEDKLNRTQEAIISYKQFLKLASADNSSIAAVNKRIEELERKSKLL